MSRRTGWIAAALAVALGGAAFVAAFPARAEPVTVDLRLSLVSESDGRAEGGFLQTTYTLQVFNLSQVEVAGYQLRVQAGSAGVLEVSAQGEDWTTCRGATSCTSTIGWTIPADTNRSQTIRVWVPTGTGISADIRLPEEYTDARPDNDMVRMTVS